MRKTLVYEASARKHITLRDLETFVADARAIGLKDELSIYTKVIPDGTSRAASSRGYVKRIGMEQLSWP